jgi:D-glycero-D-manno-heptose 1,7-bisphosphate phosphatase
MPGLFQMIGQRFGAQLTGVPMVGDLPRDVLAAQSVGCEPHLVRTGQAATMPEAELQNLRQQVTG